MAQIHPKLVLLVLCTLSLTCLLEDANAALVNYLIDCGSSSNTTIGDRVFVSDESFSKFLSTQQKVLGNTSSNSIPSSPTSPLYPTARIFTGTSKYSFPITQNGRYFVRLYFFPFNYKTYKMATASFSVSAQEFLLLGDYTPPSSSMMKEFSVNVTSDTLDITFTPSPNSFAFLNALEVVSVPNALIIDDANQISPMGGYSGLVRYALETVARVNMGGPLVNYDNDTLWRTWVPDNGFLVHNSSALSVSNVGGVSYAKGFATRDSAPVSVYGTAREMNSKNDPSSNFNVSWVFDVETGFQYLVRFHYCDIVSKSLNQLYFNVYLNSLSVSHDVDLSTLTGALGTAIFIDAVTPLSTSNKLRISIGPSSITNVYPNAILNGLEIMKMNNSMASLSQKVSTSSPSGKSKKTKVGVIVGATIGGVCLVVLAFILFIFCRRSRRRLTRQGLSKSWIPLSLTGGTSHSMGSKYSHGTTTSIETNLSYRVPFAAVQEATKKFDESLVIGIGGFGKVYKGVLGDGTNVAVKRGNPQSQQGIAEFRTEIELLSQFRHRHLVSLIGYCDEKNEMILIYEYMENGTLRSHLYGSGLPSMSWKQRLEIDRKSVV